MKGDEVLQSDFEHRLSNALEVHGGDLCEAPVTHIPETWSNGEVVTNPIDFWKYNEGLIGGVFAEQLKGVRDLMSEDTPPFSVVRGASRTAKTSIAHYLAMERALAGGVSEYLNGHTLNKLSLFSKDARGVRTVFIDNATLREEELREMERQAEGGVSKFIFVTSLRFNEESDSLLLDIANKYPGLRGPSNTGVAMHTLKLPDIEQYLRVMLGADNELVSTLSELAGGSIVYANRLIYSVDWARGSTTTAQSFINGLKTQIAKWNTKYSKGKLLNVWDIEREHILEEADKYVPNPKLGRLNLSQHS